MNLAQSVPIPVGVDTNHELIALAILIIGGWVGLFMKSWLDSKKAKATYDNVTDLKAQVSEVQGQVVNGHRGAPPMRADLDQIRAWVKDIRTAQIEHNKNATLMHEDISLLREGFGSLYREVQRMSRDHDSFERRVEEFTAREHPTARPL